MAIVKFTTCTFTNENTPNKFAKLMMLAYAFSS